MIFKKVAELGGFSAAAAQLGLPKSSISQKVSQLEQELGIRLLQRTTRRVSLTEVGERVYEAASRIAAETEDVKALAQNMREEPAGLLRVTAPHDLGVHIIGNLLGPFCELYPKITVEMDLSSRLVDLVSEGVDLALRASSGGLRDTSLVATSLGSTRLRLFASPAWLTANGTPKAIEDLHDAPAVWMIFGGRRGPTVWRLDSLAQPKLKGVEVPVRAAMRTDDMLAARHAAIAGLGVGLLPELVCLPDLESGALVRILPEWGVGEGAFHAVYPSRRHLPAKTRAFVEYLRQAFAACPAS